MLFETYGQLCEYEPHGESEILGLPLQGQANFWLSVDAVKHPALLMPAKSDDTRPDIILRAVDVEFSRNCSIKTPEGRLHEACYTIIRLKEADPDIARLFLRILEERFCTGSPPRRNAPIAESIQEIASLFSRLSHDVRDIVGLWGELYAISSSANIDTAVRAWGSKKLAKYDFVSEGFVLDVNASLSHIPKHRLSMDQLRPAGDYMAYILSLCLVEQPSGRTVGELMDALSAQIKDIELRNNFLKNCLVKGGRDIYRSELRLQTYPDSTSFKVYEGSSLPVPTTTPDQPISNIRFDIDLSGVEPIDAQAALELLSFRRAR